MSCIVFHAWNEDSSYPADPGFAEGLASGVVLGHRTCGKCGDGETRLRTPNGYGLPDRDEELWWEDAIAGRKLRGEPVGDHYLGTPADPLV